MAKRRDNWREEAIQIIKDYPKLEKELKALRGCSVTPKLTGMPGGAGNGRKVESAALRELPKDKQKRFDAVDLAMKFTKRNYENSKERIRVIELVYWKRTHTLQGAALTFPYSYDTVQGWHAEFIKLVDAFYHVL